MIGVNAQAFVAHLAALSLLLAACAAAAPQERSFDVEIKGRKLSPSPMRVNQDDTVTLRIKSDEATTFHLHGYDLEKEVEPGEAATLTFTAKASGRFDVGLHGFGSHKEEGASHKEEKPKDEVIVGAFEVQPR